MMLHLLSFGCYWLGRAVAYCSATAAAGATTVWCVSSGRGRRGRLAAGRIHFAAARQLRLQIAVAAIIELLLLH